MKLVFVGSQARARIAADGVSNLTELYSVVVEVNDDGLSIQKELRVHRIFDSPLVYRKVSKRIGCRRDFFDSSFPKGAVIVSRYVDELLICFLEQEVLPGAGIVFTQECHGRRSQHLELKFAVNKGLCWAYMSKSSKPLLSATTLNPQTVISGLVNTLLLSALQR